jgi:hypothetical protein
VAAVAACSPAYVAADGDEDDSGGSSTDGSDGSDGSDSSTGGADGSTGGDPGSGGSDDESGGAPSSGGASGGSTGGSAMGTGGDDATCSEDNECITAANFDDPCFSPGCSGPVAATESEVQRNPCLVPWEERESEPPEECAAHDPDVVCPAACEIPAPCVAARCVESTGECVIEICLP